MISLSKKLFYSVMYYALIAILCILFECLTSDYLYCVDFDHDLAELKKELKYWQDDLQGLQEMYKDKGYDVLNPDKLSQQQLADKALLEESIADGRKNVSKSIKDIGELWRDKNEVSSTLGKRHGEGSHSQDNKKLR